MRGDRLLEGGQVINYLTSKRGQVINLFCFQENSISK